MGRGFCQLPKLQPQRVCGYSHGTLSHLNNHTKANLCYDEGMKIAEIQEKAAPIFESFEVKRAALFGSTARGEDRPDSDIDILVSFNKTPGMVGYMRFIEAMESRLHKKVDVITERSLNKHLKPRIEADLITIYER